MLSYSSGNIPISKSKTRAAALSQLSLCELSNRAFHYSARTYFRSLLE
jgi:hypothetical protein